MASSELTADPRPPRPVFNPVYAFGAIVVVIALLLVAVKIDRWHHNRAPFGPDAVTAQVTGLRVVSSSGHRGSQHVMGRLEISALPAPSGSQYWLVIIDNRTHALVSLSGDPVGGDDATGAGSGWDGGLNNFAAKYSWLAPIAEIQSGDGYQDPGMTVGVPAGSSVSLPFSGVDRDSVMSTPLTTSDLTVALLMEGPDGQAWWAKRLH